MRMGQGIRTGLGHGDITCVLQTQFSSYYYFISVLWLSVTGVGLNYHDNVD